jgi:hypothetical protein
MAAEGTLLVSAGKVLQGVEAAGRIMVDNPR